jgi:hypothetical protein
MGAPDPVQAIVNQDAVVAGKLTLARIELTSSFSTDVSVPIWFFLSYCAQVCTPSPVFRAGSGPLTFTVKPGSHVYYIGPPDTPSASYTSFSNEQACANVKVDYGNTLQETNENNNDLGSCRPLVATRQLRVFFVPIALGAFPAPTCSAVQNIASRSTDFIRGTYPVADSGERAMVASVSCRALHFDDELSARLGLEHGDWRDDNGQPPPTTSVPHHDAFIGVFAEGAYPNGYGIGSAGSPESGFIFHSSIIEETQIDGIAAAQEMAHNFGWVTLNNPLNDGAHPGHLISTPAPGYWVSKGCEMGFYRWSVIPSGDPCAPSMTPIDFMYYLGISHPNDVTEWVSKPTWDFLLSSLS